ncbi:MAG: hypothetical protein QOF89_4212 [Acidobacteriota bacterium]|jgi:SAM-dependent methyltransferase|nr:hypothetical protein [Acidobacteriota bacterium]
MMSAGLQNLHFATDQRSVDNLNSEFYGQILYPWPPWSFERVQRADLGVRMLSQDIGYWDRTVLPAEPRIWVAGCGTNQALITALRFPQAQVLGSDLSAESLAVCATNARSLDVGNLELKHESINQASYTSCFDYVICTGVIHHNADPLVALSRLAGALRPEGLLELMVYNQFHRILTSSFQMALWLLLGRPAKPDLVSELPMARRLTNACPPDTLMSAFLATLEETPDARFADALLQPVEHSFTVETLQRAAAGCNIEMLTFCNDAFSRSSSVADWNLEIQDEDLRGLYMALPDAERWQITNLLLAESSPMLWFYFQRTDCPRPRKPERLICEEFLDTRFVRVKTEKEVFSRKLNGGYAGPPTRAPFPGGEPSDPLAKRVFMDLDEGAPFRETLKKMTIEPTFSRCNRLRLQLATSGGPYLEAVE